MKLPIYAEAGIPEVWIVDLEGEAIHIFREPAGDAYAQNTVKRKGDELNVLMVPDVGPLRADAILV